MGSLGTIIITIDSHDTVMLAERSHIACVRRYRTLSDYKLYVLDAVGIRGIPLHSLGAGIHITQSYTCAEHRSVNMIKNCVPPTSSCQYIIVLPLLLRGSLSLVNERITYVFRHLLKLWNYTINYDKTF